MHTQHSATCRSHDVAATLSSGDPFSFRNVLDPPIDRTTRSGSNDWDELTDTSSGAKYFVNKKTRRTTWTDHRLREAAAAAVAASGAADAAASSTPTIEEGDEEEEETASQPAAITVRGLFALYSSYSEQHPGRCLGLTTATVCCTAWLQVSTSKWVQETDPTTGAPYYCNMETGETTWERPAEISDAPAEEDTKRKSVHLPSPTHGSAAPAPAPASAPAPGTATAAAGAGAGADADAAATVAAAAPEEMTARSRELWLAVMKASKKSALEAVTRRKLKFERMANFKARVAAKKKAQEDEEAATAAAIAAAANDGAGASGAGGGAGAGAGAGGDAPSSVPRLVNVIRLLEAELPTEIPEFNIEDYAAE